MNAAEMTNNNLLCRWKKRLKVYLKWINLHKVNAAKGKSYYPLCGQKTAAKNMSWVEKLPLYQCS